MPTIMGCMSVGVFIGIGYILPIIGGYVKVVGCLWALWAQGVGCVCVSVAVYIKYNKIWFNRFTPCKQVDISPSLSSFHHSFPLSSPSSPCQLF